ncbi:MAG: PTS sugar transporter subunit IIA [Magnetococcus sp. WYHC-3]
MRFEQLLTPQCIAPELSATTKPEALRELAALLAASAGLSQEVITERLLEREQMATTGIGSGVAVPHARMDNLDRTIGVLGRSLAGIDFNAMDGRRVHLVFAILSPPRANREHLQALALVAHMLKSAQVRDRLMAMPDAASLYQAALSAAET